MNKNIEKKCLIEYDGIEIVLEDLRDSYIHEFALGKIGSIHVSRNGLLISPNTDGLNKNIDGLRELYLTYAFGEIFEATEYNPLSRKYYKEINRMIKDGTLEFLGYKIEKTDDITLEEEPVECVNKGYGRH